MKVYIDSDVILDLILKRQKFHLNAEELFNYIAKKKLTGFATPISISNVYYILNDVKKKKNFRKIIKKLRKLLLILPVDQNCIDDAIDSDMKDFENSIQYYSCIYHKIDHIVTRNKKDYRKCKIPISTPEELISILKMS